MVGRKVSGPAPPARLRGRSNGTRFCGFFWVVSANADTSAVDQCPDFVFTDSLIQPTGMDDPDQSQCDPFADDGGHGGSGVRVPYT